MKKLVIACVLSLGLASTANAAIEIDETEGFGPTYGSAVADVTIGKPLQLLGAVAGTALHIAGIPFAVASDSLDESYDVLVNKPWLALQRCTGCTPAYDAYIKSKKSSKNEVRLVVDRPSEIVIQTSEQNIVINH